MAKELIPMANYEINPITEEIADAIHEELGDLDRLPFDIVKLPSGGGLSFEIAGDDPDNPEVTQDLTGIIVHQHDFNAYWKDPYTGGSVMPDCSSMDGRHGVVTETGEICSCAECEFNQFGSDQNGGKGKACKNGKRVYLLREGEMFPLILSIPPTSVTPFRDYLAKRIVLKGKRPYEVVTKFKLTREKNDNGIAYSKLTCALVGELTADQKAQLKDTVTLIKGLAANIKLNPEESVQQTGYHNPLDIPNDDDLPFGEEAAE